MKEFCQSLLGAVVLFGVAGMALAHEVRPAYLELKERAGGEFDVFWKVPAPGGIPLAGDEIPHEVPIATTEDAKAPKTMPCGCPAPTLSQLMRGALSIHPALPKDAVTISLPQITRIQGAEIKRWTIRTGEKGLEGWEVTVHGLAATMVDVLVRIELADGRVVSRLLRPDAPSFLFGEDSAGPRVGDYFLLGVEHILYGVDHLLFVLALVLIVKGRGLLVKTITAFTIAHSITLALATLGVVNVPAAPVEAVIALSIVFVAAEIVRSSHGKKGITESAPWIVALVFGLLHGFGFAGALTEVGLPQNEIPRALLLFNVGVEAGQLAFVAVTLGVIALGCRVHRQVLPSTLNPQLLSLSSSYTLRVFSTVLRLVPPYAIGAVAMFWVIQRVALL